MKVKTLSRVRLLATPWTVADQAPPSMGFSRQEYWRGVPLPSPIPMNWITPITRASLIAQLVKNLLAMQETSVRFLGWKDPLEKGQATLSSILAWRIPWIVVHWVAKRQT